uniref:Uncharacterized protein n=1 Tax=Rhizophora mucronata TaxID=61149 RepID=A0A2P2LQH3_RHIMU
MKASGFNFITKPKRHAILSLSLTTSSRSSVSPLFATSISVELVST